MESIHKTDGSEGFGQAIDVEDPGTAEELEVEVNGSFYSLHAVVFVDTFFAAFQAIDSSPLVHVGPQKCDKEAVTKYS